MAGVANIFIHLRRHDDSTKQRIVLYSGAPQTQACVADGCRGVGRVPVEYADEFICEGGVNVGTLLRATRLTLLEYCYQMGANALVDESWECRIVGPKTTHHGTYKVDIVYTASATKSTTADPRKPVSMDKATNIPGLMTIIRRGSE
ncbi:hypothetical protein BDN70DRAFT_796670 [Pholiota conissans]|uniref:Uncharacterized protein n=1 Tax=Pholiota conissans TaxID=109636 RepID=A0A9P6CZC7_9AGAR|nr:hypothetical protein BDN70DRAFT_796670 [Pholiota conissans]